MIHQDSISWNSFVNFDPPGGLDLPPPLLPLNRRREEDKFLTFVSNFI